MKNIHRARRRAYDGAMEKRPNQIDRLSDVALFVRVAERGNFSMAAKD